MKEKSYEEHYETYRLRIPKGLSKRYKIICIKLSLSGPKQMAAMVKNFVESQEETERLMSHLKDKK